VKAIMRIEANYIRLGALKLALQIGGFLNDVQGNKSSTITTVLIDRKCRPDWAAMGRDQATTNVPGHVFGLRKLAWSGTPKKRNLQQPCNKREDPR
jgi:hypothetical protein